MLSDRYRQLLTAYVDGELTSRQRRHVARLLHRSPEARQLLLQLQEDAHSLRHLPRPQLSADLTGPVLRAIAERRLAPGQRRTVTISSASSWAAPIASWALAAAVLLLLGAASYLYFAASLDHTEKTDLARSQTEKKAPAPMPDRSLPPAVARRETSPEATPKKPSSKPDAPPVVKPPEVVKAPDKEPKKFLPDTPPASPKVEAVLTDRLETFPLSKVSDILPVVLKVRELDQDVVRKGLIAELRKDVDFRLELPCPHGSRALQRLQNAAKTIHLALVVEKGARERLKLQSPAGYAVYIEDVTPEELAQFLQQVGTEDAKIAGRKPAEAQLDWLVLTRMTPQNRKELSTLLGIDPTATEPSPKGPLGADPHKPLSDTTAQQVGRSLAGQGGLPRSEAGKPSAKPPQRFALVLAHYPIRSSPGSDEIKHFLETRKPARPGTIRVLLVLRS